MVYKGNLTDFEKYCFNVKKTSRLRQKKVCLLLKKKDRLANMIKIRWVLVLIILNVAIVSRLSKH